MNLLKLNRFHVLIGSLFAFGATAQAAETDRLTFEDFEGGVNIVTQPTQTDPQYRYLWNEYTDIRRGMSNVTSDSARFGNYGLKTSITEILSGPALSQQQFYPYETGYGWRYAREKSKSSGWKLNRYNRLKFWIKVPPQIRTSPADQENVHFGTYIRSTTTATTTAESHNGHFYHYYNIPYTGQWHQVIVDWHPNHQRSESGSTEQGLLQYPTSQPGYNYFDLLTRFYIEVAGSSTTFPVSIMVDNFEFYYESANENIADIYSLHGTFTKTNNTLILGWMRDKNKNNAVHEVKYAFSDIHTSGWDKATPAPNGIFGVGGWSGYNGVRYTTNQIAVGSNNNLYVAIKPQDSTTFRQIIIPLNDTSLSQSPPSPPPDESLKGGQIPAE